MRNPFFPAWYLPKGTKYALEVELEGASSSCERWAIWCGVFVVLSVVAELIIAWYEPPYKTFLKLSVWPDAVIGIGIIGEVLFGMWDSRIQTELRDRSNKKLGAAEKEAGDAKKEAAEARERTALIEKLTAWRRISAEQHSAIVDAIKGEVTPSLDVLIEWERPDTEAFSYAFELVKIFKDAGVEKIRGGPNSFRDWQRFGLYAAGSPSIDTPAIGEAFARAGMPLALLNIDLSTHLPRNVPAPTLYIFVAPKLPLHFETLASEGNANKSSPANASVARESSI